MKGKKFTSLVDGRIVAIKDVFEDIVILNDNTKVKASRLLDKNFYEEYIDPASFFQNQSLINTFAQKIKQIPDEFVSKMTNEERTVVNESLKDNSFRPTFNESAIIESDPEIEKLELMRKYGIKENSIQNKSLIESNKQLERFKTIIDELQSEDEGEIQRIEVSRDEPTNESTPQNEDVEVETKKQTITVEDPIISMFRNVKRNKDFKISIDIENKIPRADFIEMMEDSYNTSIIDFLAEEFTNNILKNPNLIKNKIKDEIKSIVYGTKVNAGQTQSAPKTRKPRTKKINAIND